MWLSVEREYICIVAREIRSWLEICQGLFLWNVNVLHHFVFLLGLVHYWMRRTTRWPLRRELGEEYFVWMYLRCVGLSCDTLRQRERKWLSVFLFYHCHLVSLSRPSNSITASRALEMFAQYDIRQKVDVLRTCFSQPLYQHIVMFWKEMGLYGSI